MQGKINVGTAVVIVVACGVLLGFGIYKYLTYSPPLVIAPTPPHEVAQKLKEPAIPKPPPDVRSLLEQGQYHVVSDYQINELGAEIEQYIPQMVKELKVYAAKEFRCKIPRKPSAHRLLVAAGEHSLPAVIELLDESGYWNTAMDLLAEMGETALPVLPRLEKKLQEDYDLTRSSQIGHVRKVKDTMNAISPDSGNAAIEAELGRARTWQADIEGRLERRSTRDAAYLEAVGALNSENLTRLAVAEETLTEANYSALAYEAMLEMAQDYPRAIFLRLDDDGSVNYEQLGSRSTPQFYSLCRIVGAHVNSARPELHKLLAKPEYTLWGLSANAEVLHGNPSEHLEELVGGLIEYSNLRWPDLTFKFLLDNHLEVKQILAQRLAEMKTPKGSKAEKLQQDLDEITSRQAFKFRSQNFVVDH